MSAHNPLSARLAELAGFDGIWASGFELSAACGVPDASLLSFSQHLDMTRAIVERVSVPVIADLDTGYGNAVNVMHLVGAYARAGVAAVVIEDKTFPKDTSLLAGGRQDLVRVEEFQGKIAAARAAGGELDLLVVGRTEALIAGLGLEEALKRVQAYSEAGADMILVHSKQKTPDEIVAFARRWQGETRLVVVPDGLPRSDRGPDPRARQYRHGDLRQSCGARCGHCDAASVWRGPGQWRNSQCRLTHHLGRGDFRIAAGGRDEGDRAEISAVSRPRFTTSRLMSCSGFVFCP